MAQAIIFEDSLERNIAFYRDTLIQIQCHNYNWEFEKVPHVVANMLIGDMRRILRCVIFLKENRILLLTDELDIPSSMELHENIRKFVDVDLECRHFHGQFTISHIGELCKIFQFSLLILIGRFCLIL